jgi:protein BUR2
MKELVVACCRVAQKNPTLKIDEQTKDFWRWRDTILFNEDVMLEAICFDLTLDAPHKIMYDMLRAFNLEHEKKLRNAAWAFLNDSNLTQLCLLFNSRVIAAASIFCAARHCEVEFPDQKGRPWWEYLQVRLTDIQRACNYMATIYENSDSGYLYANSSTSPEDMGNANLAKTRLQRSQTPLSSTSMEHGGSDSGIKRSREGSVLSLKKEESVRVAHEQAVTEELMQDQPNSKKAKLDSHEANGVSQEADDAGSEEGELEG